MAADKYTCFFGKLLQLSWQQNLNGLALKVDSCIINTILIMIMKNYYVSYVTSTHFMKRVT